MDMSSAKGSSSYLPRIRPSTRVDGRIQFIVLISYVLVFCDYIFLFLSNKLYYFIIILSFHLYILGKLCT